jgi:hypothetical protein
MRSATPYRRHTSMIVRAGWLAVAILSLPAAPASPPALSRLGNRT